MNRTTKSQINEKIWKAIGATEEFLALKYRPGYTPWQIMEIRGSFIYFMFMAMATIIAALFQGLANVTHKAIIIPLILNSFAILLAYVNYRKKRALKYAGPWQWTAAIFFSTNIILSRYIYALLINWEFALSSYNISILFFSSVISSIMLYDRKLFKAVFVLILVNWLTFLVLARLSGAGMYISVTHNSAVGGFNILRELFIIIIFVFLSASVYLNLPIIEAFGRKSAEQQAIIENYNRYLTCEIDAKTKELQNELKEKKATAESLRVLSEAVKYSPISISITDIEGSIVYINPWFESVTGYSLDEIKGKKPGPLLNKNLSREERMAIYSTVQAGGEWRGELKNIKKNGEEFWDRVAISSIKDAESRITHFVSMQEDITLRKKIEDELADSEGMLKERNRIMEKEISIAEIVQKTLLQYEPDSSSIYSAELWFKSVEKIGGDFFSIKTYSPGHLGIFIGDVSGHGVASALFTSLIKFITDELFDTYPDKPSEYLERLNSGLYGYMSNYFLTGIYLFINYDETSATYHLNFANGGHPSPVIVKSDGQVILTKSQGPLIGYNMDVNYRAYHLELNSGDSVFLFTDGLPETTDSIEGGIVGFGNKLQKLFLDSIHDSDIGSTGSIINSLINRLNVIRATDIIEDDLLIIGIKMP